MRSKRMFTAVDSHTDGMPTRVITGGVGVIPGATINEMRLNFMEHLGDIRLLLMNEPRDPTGADVAGCRLGRRPYRVVRMSADVRSQNDRRRDRARGNRHGRGGRAGDHHPTGYPTGLVVCRVTVTGNETNPPHHPEIDGIDHCHHAEFVTPGSTAQRSRHAMAIYPGWFDRSPCGTGTSARMAALYSRGQLGLNQDFLIELFIAPNGSSLKPPWRASPQ